MMLPTALRPLPLVRSRAWAGLLAATVFVLGLFAAAPELHAALHHDAAHASHYCAVDMFAAGVALIATAITLREVAQRLLGTVPAQPVRAIITPDWRQPPGRGPPTVSIL